LNTIKFVFVNKIILKPRIKVLAGDIQTRALLEDVVTRDSNMSKYLRPFLQILDEKIDSDDPNVNWWVTIDEITDTVNGFLSVVTVNNNSYLEHAWTNIRSKEEFQITTEMLTKTWVKEKKSKVNNFHVDISPNSGIIKGLENVGFYFNKFLLTVYNIPTDYYESNIAQDFIQRKPEINELSKIYNELILPDLDKDSPIFITEDQFSTFDQTLHNIRENWILIESTSGQYLGFGASFLEKRGEQISSVLYGPHGVSRDIIDFLMAEFLTHWKLHGQQKIRLLTIQPFDYDIEYKYNMERVDKYSKIRYTL
jgi:hypothetical protein